MVLLVQFVAVYDCRNGRDKQDLVVDILHDFTCFIPNGCCGISGTGEHHTAHHGYEREIQRLSDGQSEPLTGRFPGVRCFLQLVGFLQIETSFM